MMGTPRILKVALLRHCELHFFILLSACEAMLWKGNGTAVTLLALLMRLIGKL